MKPIPIVIVGAGVAGLSAALSLAKAGFETEVFDQAADLAPIGAGLQLSPNALRVLERLGVLSDIEARSVSSRHVTLRSGRGGGELVRVPVEAADGTGYLAVHRADLQDVLLRAVEAEPKAKIRLGMVLDSLRQEGERSALTFRDRATGAEETREARLVIGADGVHSVLARELGLPAPRDTGLVAARYRLDPTVLSGHGIEGIEAWLGPRRHAVVYPLRGGSQINIVLIAPSTDDGSDVAAGFSHWDERLRTFVAAAEFQGTWPLFEVEPERRLVHDSRICLIGDAGHAMLPFAAQGAAMAIEDAYVLAHELAFEPDLRSALRRFEAERLPRLEKVRRRVAFHRFAYHLPRPVDLGRNLILAARSPDALRADLAWLYDWRP